jgi:hypothetical protein
VEERYYYLLSDSETNAIGLEGETIMGEDAERVHAAGAGTTTAESVSKSQFYFYEFFRALWLRVALPFPCPSLSESETRIPPLLPSIQLLQPLHGPWTCVLTEETETHTIQCPRSNAPRGLTLLLCSSSYPMPLFSESDLRNSEHDAVY